MEQQTDTEKEVNNTVLDENYDKPTRPFSQKELQDKKKEYIRSLRLSDEMVSHSKTKYKYYVKKYGNKEKIIIENREKNVEDYGKDIGNCSVSWKISRTHPRYKKYARDMCGMYMESQDKERLTHYDVELFRVFYTWLYHEK